MPTTIQAATRSFESWLDRCATRVVPSQLRDKHAMMREDLFAFMRGTYYRWAQQWPAAVGDIARAPVILAVGDLHTDSFGTWRDIEGRMCWGVDDFDEAYPLPYTNDLVRLAASFRLAAVAGLSSISLRDGCDVLLERYTATLRKGGEPLVLAEGRSHMETLGISELDPPDDFWAKLKALPTVRKPPPAAVTKAFRVTLPRPDLPYRVARREAGTGSMGQQRFVAIALWEGACVAREAKELVPSASVWLAGGRERGQRFYARAISSARRAPDPFHCVVGRWLLRRLSPESNPISIADLPVKRDEEVLVGAMGAEVANVHLGTPRQTRRILADLRHRPPNWLRQSAKTMAKLVEHDWKDFRR